MATTSFRTWVGAGAIGAVLVYGCVGDEPTSGTPPAGDAGASSSSGTASSSSSGSSSSSTSSSGSSGEAGADAGPACSPTGAFGDVAEVSGLHVEGQSEIAVRFSTDLLSAVIARAASGAPGRLFIADRGDVATPFGSGTDLGGPIHLAMGVGRATFADDKTTLYFEGTSQQGIHDLYYSTRSAPGQPWSNAMAIPTLQGFGAHFAPYFRNGTLYLAHNDGTNGLKLYYAKRQAASVSEFEPKVELTGFGGGDWPLVTRDELTLFFLRDGKIQQASRSTAIGTFGSIAELPATVNTATGKEKPTDVSPDGCTLYFTREVGGESRVFKATRAK